MLNIYNNFYRTSIKALILDDGKKFLLVLEKNGLWELPGGGLEYHETPHECIIREIKEEMNLVVVHINRQPSYFVKALNIDGQWKTSVIYETKVKNLLFNPSDECIEYRFFTSEDALKENIYPIVREFIKEYNPDNH